MPILVSDFTWTQSPQLVTIRVPLNGIHPKNVDLFTCNSYIKAHYPPFLFEAFLLHDVAIESSKCHLHEDNMIIFELMKFENVEWEKLEKNLTKQEKLKLKQEFIEKCQEQTKMKFEEKVTRKNELDRFTVRQAMEIDTKQHNIMDERRDAERKKSMDDLEKWRTNKEEVPSRLDRYHLKSSGVTITELPNDDSTPQSNVLELKKREIKKQSPAVTSDKKLVKSEYIDKKKAEVAKRVLPKLRQTAEMDVNFTARAFPTPSRESTAHEEETWLKNITAARKATGFVSEDLRPEEQDPQWCKEKGDEFFRNGNFLGAISAYTHGIKLSEKHPSLYANRAATHFALGNFNKCLNDCSTALDLMKPACEGNRISRARCIARRAAALTRIGLLNKAIEEMKAAAKLLPDDEKIKKDLFDMERAWEQNPDSD